MTRADCGFLDSHGRPDPVKLSLVGPTTAVKVGFDANWGSGGRPRSIDEFQALIDTGAQYSHIDTALAERLAIPAINRWRVSGSAGLHEVDVYLAQVYVRDLDFTQHGQFLGADLSSGFDGHTVLLGRSFLAQFKMIYDGKSGVVTLEQ